MDDEQKERLEQELGFLKESLDSGVISEEEYEKGRDRIEAKIKEIEGQEEEKEDSQEQKEEARELKESHEDSIGEKQQEEQDKGDIEAQQPEDKDGTEAHSSEEEPKEGPDQPAEEPKEDKSDQEKPVEETSQFPEKKGSGILKKCIYTLFIILIVMFFFSSMRKCSRSEDSQLVEPQSSIGEEASQKGAEFKPECSADADCSRPGMISGCLNPGTKEARCEFKEDAETSLKIISDRNCKFCETSTMETIIKEIFPNVRIETMDYGAEGSRELVDALGIEALPAYVFDSNVVNAANFEDFSSALVKKEDSYVITNTASGAVYYFRRQPIKNKLELYTLPGDGEKLEASLKRVLDLFGGKIDFTKNLVSGRQKEFLEKELAINTYPTFLLNNQFKFRGVIPANIIKQKICTVNSLSQCSQDLPKV
ncbi:hypothetical protein KY358_03525 [Candidatus Woesearchaeota archaeon]|nr:hypothetical protein [Candidatus Woesearchaeota archaeon]